MKRAITMRMENEELNLQELFKNLYCERDFTSVLEIAKNAQSDRRPFVLRKLAEMFNDIGMKCEYGRDIAYYNKRVSQLNLPNIGKSYNEKILKTLKETYVKYPQPKEFMQRIVDSLDTSEPSTDSLELRILKRFLATVNVKANKNYYSKELLEKEIDEAIFESKETYKLVKAAYELANGIFASDSTIKEYLFLFAFAYDMRYYSTKTDKIYSEYKDVEKNLFTDYYCDNLTRYMYQQSKNSGISAEPSGIGINPKNFVDAIFVYYLNNEELDAKEKVSKFYIMVNAAKDAWKTEKDFVDVRKKVFEEASTKEYKEKIDTVICKLSEADLLEYILDNFYCDLRYTCVDKKGVKEKSKGVFELKMTLNTAYKSYCEIKNSILELLELPKDVDFSKIDLRKGKDNSKKKDSESEETENERIVKDSALFYNAPNVERIKDILSIDESETEFMQIMETVFDKRLYPKKALGLNSAENMTRTKLIAIYYHYYCVKKSEDDYGKWISFKDVYIDMISGLNIYLDEAGYQRINVKNMYDVFVIFFAYCNINDLL